MASYMIRGLPSGSIQTFKQRCRAASVSPDELLRALIVHTNPTFNPVAGETIVSHQLTIHHRQLSGAVATSPGSDA